MLKKSHKLMTAVATTGIMLAVAAWAFPTATLQSQTNSKSSLTATTSTASTITMPETGTESGPDARLAANLLSPDAPVRGPLRMEELKHIKLRDQDGQQFSLHDLKGETVLINFMFAGCTTVCPTQTISLRRVHNELKLDSSKDRIKLVSISIAPLSDTPKQLKSFAKRFQIDHPTWRFAMTTQAQTDELSREFSVGVKPLDNGQLDHRSLLYLINPDGMMIQQYKGAQVDVERLKKELRIVDSLRKQDQT